MLLEHTVNEIGRSSCSPKLSVMKCSKQRILVLTLWDFVSRVYIAFLLVYWEVIIGICG
jgi:hypothetical protein